MFIFLTTENSSRAEFHCRLYAAYGEENIMRTVETFSNGSQCSKKGEQTYIMTSMKNIQAQHKTKLCNVYNALLEDDCCLTITDMR